MTRDRFNFIWRHFHITAPDELEEEDDLQDDEDDTLDLVEQTCERVVQDQENEGIFDENKTNEEDNESTSNETEGSTTPELVWFQKLKPFIDHVRLISANLIWILGTFLSLDEMMIRFMGRSAETHRIKGKPIGEGYKFFVLTTNFGFIVNFTPDGRNAAKKNLQEYSKVISTLRDMGIGVVGTSRFRAGWPCKELRAYTTAEFNDFIYTIDEHGTLVARWMDNGLVFLIDDYNHWMGGVDISDQRIAYYHPNLRCLRNWIPIFIQIVSIIRSNSLCSKELESNGGSCCPQFCSKT